MDLARAHGLSAQAVRNYERDGLIPPARRTAAGYRVYTDLHVGALAAYVALLPGYGYRTAAEIMRAVGRDDLEAALRAVDAAHVQLHRDRETLRAVASASSVLAGLAPSAGDGPPVPVGAVAHRLGITAATLRKWERAGILVPVRDRVTKYRVYSPADVRDAELAHLLRRGGYPLAHIATVLDQVRSAGGADALAASLTGWQERLTARGRAMLTGAARLADYLRLLEHDAAPSVGVTGGAADLGAS